MAKAPKKGFWERWEYRAWKADKKLADCDPSTRGIWTEFISSMMEDETYYLTGTIDDLAVHARSKKSKTIAAIQDLFDHDAATVGLGSVEDVVASLEERNAKVTLNITLLSRQKNAEITVISRKRMRALRPKELNRLRQERWRERHKNNAEVTPYSKSKSKDNSKELSEKRERTPARITPPGVPLDLLLPHEAPGLGFAVEQLFEVFPRIQIDINKGALISQTVADLPESRKAWVRTLAKYKGNHDPKAKKYLPENVGTLLSVYADELDRTRSTENGTNQKHHAGTGKPTNLERIERTKRVIDQYPTEAELRGQSGKN